MIIIYIVYKSTLNEALEKYYDQDIFAKMMDETNSISESILRAKKIRENAGITNYARIPDRYFSKDFTPLENEMLDRLFILIAGYIVTFCGTFSRIKLDKIAKKINMDKETLRDYIEEYGKAYNLVYEVEKDRFRRINRYIKYRR